jgi:ribosomal RNA-processing protein 8
LQRSGASDAAGGDAPHAAPVAPAAQPPKAGKAPKPSLLEKAAAQLAGGRFRWLNEALYTRNGAGAWELLSGEPAMFAEYHAGFRKQTASWPRQPLDECIAWLRRCPATWAVADFGCGDARLAAAAPQTTVHSFDLVAAAPGVVACDMCAVPLEDGAVQAAVFCLSLMGTDYGLALAEAHRVLAPRGALWIAEVRSRFEGADGGVDAFLRALAALGFTLRARDESDTMFIVLRLIKADAPGAKQPRWPALKACEYKRR